LILKMFNFECNFGILKKFEYKKIKKKMDEKYSKYFFSLFFHSFFYFLKKNRTRIVEGNKKGRG
jgi:hypothetical protein